jgi:DNA polymerase-4
VKIRYSDFQTEQKQSVINYTASDEELICKAKELFASLYTRRQLIRLLGIRFSDIIAGTYQINVFTDTQKQIKLYQAIDSVKKQYGEKYVIRAGGYDISNSAPVF